MLTVIRVVIALTVAFHVVCVVRSAFSGLLAGLAF